MCSARVSEFNMSQNDSLLIERLDLIEEYWDTATIQLAEYQQKIAQCYTQDIRVREFSAGDLVLRKAVGSLQDTNAGKLAGVGAYYLEDMDEIPLS